MCGNRIYRCNQRETIREQLIARFSSLSYLNDAFRQPTAKRNNRNKAVCRVLMSLFRDGKITNQTIFDNHRTSFTIRRVSSLRRDERWDKPMTGETLHLCRLFYREVSGSLPFIASPLRQSSFYVLIANTKQTMHRAKRYAEDIIFHTVRLLWREFPAHLTFVIAQDFCDGSYKDCSDWDDCRNRRNIVERGQRLFLLITNTLIVSSIYCTYDESRRYLNV